jgi:hypothetical protein
MERRRLLVTNRAFSVLRTGTIRAKQPSRSSWTLGRKNLRNRCDILKPMTNHDTEETIAHDDLNAAFRSGAIFEAREEDLERYVAALGSISILNEPVRTKAVVRALAINHIQMSRTLRALEGTMKSLDAANGRTQKVMLRLTWAAVGLAVAQVAAAILPLVKDAP